MTERFEFPAYDEWLYNVLDNENWYFFTVEHCDDLLAQKWHKMTWATEQLQFAFINALTPLVELMCDFPKRIGCD